MSEPASVEDLEKAKTQLLKRIDAMDTQIENLRAQNSAEHGSLFTKLLHITEVMHWIRKQWERFTRVP